MTDALEKALDAAEQVFLDAISSHNGGNGTPRKWLYHAIRAALPHLGNAIGYISKTQAEGLLKGYQGVWTVSHEQNSVYSEAVFLAPPAPAVAIEDGE